MITWHKLARLRGATWLAAALRVLRSPHRWLAVLTLMAPLQAANAHLMPERQGTVHLVDKRAYVVLALPVSAFPGLDDNGDGLSAASELQRHEADIRQRIVSGLQLRDADLQTQGLAHWKEVLFLLPSQEDAKDNYFLMMGVAEFAAAPQRFCIGGPLLDSTSAGRDTLKITATRTLPGQIEVTDIGLLSDAHPSFTFFAPATDVVMRFAGLGLEHILEGLDHVLFLIALLACGMAVCRWAVLLTCFTFAHGITFAMASLGWVTATTRVVEPLIALSIVGVAGLHLAGVQMRLRVEAALVVVVGLVHGLGFASALGGQGLSTMYPVWSVLGFNAGVEAAQVLIALVLFVALSATTRLVGKLRALQVGRGVSALAVAMGSYWLVDRLLNV
jgi:hydrogenase/urease accessory protein HupE